MTDYVYPVLRPVRDDNLAATKGFHQFVLVDDTMTMPALRSALGFADAGDVEQQVLDRGVIMAWNPKIPQDIATQNRGASFVLALLTGSNIPVYGPAILFERGDEGRLDPPDPEFRLRVHALYQAMERAAFDHEPF